MLLQQIYISDDEIQSTRISSLPTNITPYGVTTYVAGGRPARRKPFDTNDLGLS
jgi:hypothetical protein